MSLVAQLGVISVVLMAHYGRQRFREWQETRLAQQAILAARR